MQKRPPQRDLIIFFSINLFAQLNPQPVYENETVKLAFNHGFSKPELRKIEAAILENFLLIKTTWDEHCKGTPQKQYKKGNN